MQYVFAFKKGNASQGTSNITGTLLRGEVWGGHSYTSSYTSTALPHQALQEYCPPTPRPTRVLPSHTANYTSVALLHRAIQEWCPPTPRHTIVLSSDRALQQCCPPRPRPLLQHLYIAIFVVIKSVAPAKLTSSTAAPCCKHTCGPLYDECFNAVRWALLSSV